MPQSAICSRKPCGTVPRSSPITMQRDCRLLVPGVESIALHPHRDIEIQADLHAETTSKLLARPQLLVGGPLYEFHELDLALVGAGAQFGTLIVIRASPFLRPFPP